MTHGNVRPWTATDLFPALMVNPLGAILVCMSRAMLRLADVVEQMNSPRSSESQEHRSVLRDMEPAKSRERSKLRLISPIASKDSGRAARARKANSHKRTNPKG